MSSVECVICLDLNDEKNTPSHADAKEELGTSMQVLLTIADSQLRQQCFSTGSHLA